MILEHWGATDDEIEASLPGDEHIDRPGMSATRSITVGSDPDTVFGYLAQMGTGRGGWYSYDLIDNFGRRSTRDLHPAWQVTQVGEGVPAGPIEFLVSHLDRPRHLVLVLAEQRPLLGHAVAFSLAYRLDAVDGGTRVVSRARARIGGPLSSLATAALCIGDGVMVRKQLLGLADRCPSAA